MKSLPSESPRVYHWTLDSRRALTTFFILRLPARTMIDDAKEGFRYRLDQG